jgi:hypothetical protein
VISQADFEKFVKDYNEDYLLLLKRASLRHYDCLISAFMVLKDLYSLIQVLFDTGNYRFQELPCPLTIRADTILFEQLGFGEQEIQNIFGFLEHVKATQGMEFEACLEAGTVAMCSRVK